MKNALITGANQGIGFEVARQLAALGFHVIITSRDLKKGQKALDKLLEAGRRHVSLLQLDVTDPASIQNAVSQLQGQITQLDVLINNAGISGGVNQKIHSIGMDTLRKVFETNFFGVVQTSQAFLPLLSKSSLPVIVNVSSELGSLSTHLNGDKANYLSFDAYSAAKTALNAFTVLMAGQFRGKPFKINSVTPGYTATNLNNYQGVHTPEAAAKIITKYATINSQGPTGGFFGPNGEIDW